MRKKPRATKPEERPAGPTVLATGVAGRREHAFRSLLELSHDLTVARDLHHTADLLLLNLMGQVGTGRAGLWLLPEPGARPVLLRAHGLNRNAANALLDACHRLLWDSLAHDPAPATGADLAVRLGPVGEELAHHLDLALLAPLMGQGEILGLLAMGSRMDRRPYDPDDLEILTAALGMVGVVVQNNRLYNRLLENNRQLRGVNDRLLEHDRLKSQFLDNVNHELRTPLAVVEASLECAIDHGSVDQRLRTLLAAALERSRHLQGLIENLLTMSEAARGRLEVELETGDVAALLGAFHAERLPGVSDSLRELTCEIRGMLLARFDRQRLLQVLNELVDNAVKFTPRGTSLRLSASAHDADGRDWARIELADDGPGIPPERMRALFNAFEQVDGSSTRAVGGMGVGLASARDLVERMGGSLEARSTLGSGSSFTILLPVA